MSGKKLCKSQKKMIFGVCGGIADYFGIDPSIVRLITVILLICSFGTVLLIYILAAIIMPQKSLDDMTDEDAEKLKSANVNDEDKKFKKHFKKSEDEKEENADDFDSYFEKEKDEKKE